VIVAAAGAAKSKSNVNELLRVLVQVAGINVNAANTRGMTPLHYAAMNGNAAAVQLLVTLGADTDLLDCKGHTALYFACQNQNYYTAHLACVELLLALGANVRSRELIGWLVRHPMTAQLSLCLAADAENDLGELLRESSASSFPTLTDIETARRRIAKTRLDLVRDRALEICIGLHPLNINALELCEILMHSFGALGSLILFHQWWAIAIKVKHFQDSRL
jgi:hypothetical protein